MLSGEKRRETSKSAGKPHPRIAAGLASLMHLQLRVIEKTEFEKRLDQGGAAVAESIGRH